MFPATKLEKQDRERQKRVEAYAQRLSELVTVANGSAK